MSARVWANLIQWCRGCQDATPSKMCERCGAQMCASCGHHGAEACDDDDE